jgi:hypothetical protein
MRIGGFYFQDGKKKYLPAKVDGCEEDLINAIQLLAKYDGIFSAEEVLDDDYLKEISIYFSREMYFPFLTDGENGNANYFTLNSNEFHGDHVIDFTGEAFPASAATKNLELIKIICLRFFRGASVSEYFQIKL